MSSQPVYAFSAADYGNLGDAIIRREALSAVRHAPEFHIYTGSGGSDWEAALGLPEHARIYRRENAAAWLFSLLRSRRPVLVLEPGEVRVHGTNRGIEFLMLILTAFTRLKRGRVVRPSRGLVGDDRVALALHRLGCRMSQMVSWRNERSQTLASHGFVSPDMAFGDPPWLGASVRDLVVVSLRGDRPLDDIEWLVALRDFCDSEGLRLTASSQVRADDKRTLQLGELLSCETILMHGTPLTAHEETLRQIYRRSRLVLSDRLHALILAASAGAAPIEVAYAPTFKARDVFAAIGHTLPSYDFRSLSKLSAFREATEAAEQANDRLKKLLTDAQVEVDRLKNAIHQLVLAGTNDV